MNIVIGILSPALLLFLCFYAGQRVGWRVTGWWLNRRD